MTKAKSLVTILVDKSFSQFPIDSERYELAVLLEDIAWYLSNDPYQATFMREDARIREFASSCIDVALAHAKAFITHQFALRETNCIVSRGMYLRSARVMRAFDDYPGYWVAEGCSFSNEDDIVREMFRITAKVLKEQIQATVNVVPKRTEVST